MDARIGKPLLEVLNHFQAEKVVFTGMPHAEEITVEKNEEGDYMMRVKPKPAVEAIKLDMKIDNSADWLKISGSHLVEMIEKWYFDDDYDVDMSMFSVNKELVDFVSLKRLILLKYEIGYDKENNDFVVLYVYSLVDNKNYYIVLYHERCCCEIFSLDYREEADDFFKENAGAEIISLREEVISKKYEGESITSTFYHIQMEKDSTTLTFRGESNGYYSEEVDVCIIDAQDYLEYYNKH